MSLIDLALGETSVVMPEKELRQICTDLESAEEKLHDLLRVVLISYAIASRRRDGLQDFKALERWIQDNYVELRGYLPPEVKRLYLSHLAFQDK